MKRVLLDQGLAPGAAELLRHRGIDAVHVFEVGMHTSDDTEILDRARDELRVCVTLDHDFHAHLALTRSGRPSVVLLRVQGLDSHGQAALIERILVDCEVALAEGAAVSADRSTIRVRRLPLT